MQFGRLLTLTVGNQSQAIQIVYDERIGEKPTINATIKKTNKKEPNPSRRYPSSSAGGVSGAAVLTTVAAAISRTKDNVRKLALMYAAKMNGADDASKALAR